jgi:hypothetical protein
VLCPLIRAGPPSQQLTKRNTRDLAAAGPLPPRLRSAPRTPAFPRSLPLDPERREGAGREGVREAQGGSGVVPF